MQFKIFKFNNAYCHKPVLQYFSSRVFQEICKQPQLFPDDPVEAHPKQGILGDCWLLCACSMLIKNQCLLNKVNTVRFNVWDVFIITANATYMFNRVHKLLLHLLYVCVNRYFHQNSLCGVTVFTAVSSGFSSGRTGTG